MGAGYGAWRGLGMGRLSKRFGKLPFAKLMEAAIHYAKDGFPVAPLTASRWTAAKNLAGEFEDFAKEFVPNGHTPGAGEIFVNRDAARSLQLIADSQGEAYYRGELAQKFIAHCVANWRPFHRRGFGNAYGGLGRPNFGRVSRRSRA